MASPYKRSVVAPTRLANCLAEFFDKRTAIIRAGEFAVCLSFSALSPTADAGAAEVASVRWIVHDAIWMLRLLKFMRIFFTQCTLVAEVCKPAVSIVHHLH